MTKLEFYQYLYLWWEFWSILIALSHFEHLMMTRPVESEVLEHFCMNAADKSIAFCEERISRDGWYRNKPLQSTHLSYIICKQSDVKNQQSLLRLKKSNNFVPVTRTGVFCLYFICLFVYLIIIWPITDLHATAREFVVFVFNVAVLWSISSVLIFSANGGQHCDWCPREQVVRCGQFLHRPWPWWEKQSHPLAEEKGANKVSPTHCGTGWKVIYILLSIHVSITFEVYSIVYSPPFALRRRTVSCTIAKWW